MKSGRINLEHFTRVERNYIHIYQSLTIKLNFYFNFYIDFYAGQKRLYRGIGTAQLRYGITCSSVKFFMT